MSPERKTIHKAHERSRELGLDPEARLPRISLDRKALEILRHRNKTLLELSEPLIGELMASFEEGHAYIVILTDSSGTILELFGEAQALEEAHAVNLKKGISMNEDSTGTNAIGTAILEKRALRVSGEEHYAKAFRDWSCAAAPIFSIEGMLLGTVNLTTRGEKENPYALGLVRALAASIESRINSVFVQEQLYDAQQYAFSIMNHLTFGLIAIDLMGRIHWVNDTACRTLNIRRTRLLDKKIDTVYKDWNHSRQIVDQGEELLDVEAELHARAFSGKYLINLYAIRNERRKQIGYVLSFRPISRMLSLINKYSDSPLSYSFDMIIARSKLMKSLIDYARNIAKTPSTILITGESGTGKEVFAQAIHNASDRRNKSFVAINCGAISSGLIESELFGYEEGAFTGAAKGGKIGKFEQADGGTLFLDEIGEMPVEMQVKLLRVIQEKQLVRVGGSDSKKVDVRIIAATNKNLEAEVQNGTFRQDLFYRLSVIPLSIPPLRNRKMDIPLLYHYFLAQKAAKLKRPIPETQVQLMKQIVQYDWPGNVREIENFAEKAVILNGDSSLLLPALSKSEAADDEESYLLWSDPTYTPTLEEIEKEVITRYLDIFSGNISRCAEALGIGRNTLYMKLEKYGIDH